MFHLLNKAKEILNLVLLRLSGTTLNPENQKCLYFNLNSKFLTCANCWMLVSNIHTVI